MGKSRRNNHHHRPNQGGYGTSRRRGRNNVIENTVDVSTNVIPMTENHFRSRKQEREFVFVPRTEKQREYHEAILKNDLTFSIGPEGTGKTYVALTTACQMFREGTIDTIICSRVTVGADEDPGTYPGDPNEKIAPWLTACREVLDICLGKSTVDCLIRNGQVRFVPFAIMRGMNWRNAFVLLDEAQNATPKQVRLFVTRHTSGVRMVVDGGLEQKDTPNHIENGLIDAMDVLVGLPDVGYVEFTAEDIVRSKFVKAAVEAYERKRPANKK